MRPGPPNCKPPPPLVAADWANGVLYGATSTGIVQISSDLKTITSFGPPTFSGTSLVLSGGRVYLQNSGGRNAFVTKLDPSGNVVYSTFFGGSGDDPATAMTVDAAGNVYVTGTLYYIGTGSSSDFPVTKGAYSSTPLSRGE